MRQTIPIQPTPTLSERFWAKVDKSGECWLWKAAHYRGYGIFGTTHGRSIRAHRYSYTERYGPIPEGLVLDHLCREKRCVRPDHLEAVTQAVNVYRGESFSAKNAAKTHCPLGHEYTLENTKFGKHGRECKTCAREKRRKKRQRQGN